MAAMPITDELARRWDGIAVQVSHLLLPRVVIPSNSSSPPGLMEANTRDPFTKSGKYALGWVYFCSILLMATTMVHTYQSFTDRVRAAMSQEELYYPSVTSSPADSYELAALPFPTDTPTNKFFPHVMEGEKGFQNLARDSVTQPGFSGWRPLLLLIAAFRFISYRNIPDWTWNQRCRPVAFPPLSVVAIGFAAVIFSLLYTFVPQPLYWQSIQYGSPPVAVRSGMLAVALLPWVVACAMKANIISILTGIGHERLNVYHRWGAYLLLLLSLIHTIPFYITPITDAEGLREFQAFFNQQNYYVYGSGIAALVPLGFLTVHSLPILRHAMYELFLMLHWPVSAIFIGMMFWHCHNYLTSWAYLWATVAIWASSWLGRILYTNFLQPWRISWLIGDEAAVTLLPENAVKITIPTQTKWRPGQFVYIRMPGISLFENHPFTIASLCSEDFPSEYSEQHRDMLLLFRPFSGFTRKVVESALDKGPWHSYRAFIDGPYGGMKRRIESFDRVVLIAGGSGITAVVSQLLDLIKRMRDGRAVTRNVQVIWALKRPETMEWFKEELKICRDCAPPDSVRCRFFITAAERAPPVEHERRAPRPVRGDRPLSAVLHDAIDGAFMDIAEKRSSYLSKRNSGVNSDQNHAESSPDPALHHTSEPEDLISPIPQAHLKPSDPIATTASTATEQQNPNHFTPPPPFPHLVNKPIHLGDAYPFAFPPFPASPQDFENIPIRFGLPPPTRHDLTHASDGWSIEYGRPDLPFLLRELSASWGSSPNPSLPPATGSVPSTVERTLSRGPAILRTRGGRAERVCVFVCGPPGLRGDVAATVARLQNLVFAGDLEELCLHTENFAL